MSNRALQFKHNRTVGSGDTVNSSVLQRGDWLGSLIYTSLMTDARATEEQTPDWATDRGGYWGDDLEAQSMGSLLWTLKREKLTPQTLRKAEDFCQTALKWLIKKGYIKKTQTRVERIAANRAGILVTVTKLDGSEKTFKEEFVTDA